MRFTILAPWNTQTGGPEACYQLSDALLQAGLDARLLLLTPDDMARLHALSVQGHDTASAPQVFPPRSNTVIGYDVYQHVLTHQLDDDPNEVIVLPEVYLDYLPYLRHKLVVVWWLSVDNAFGALSRLPNTNLLRQTTVLHATQSQYAARFLFALGISSQPLSDYTTAVSPTADQPPTRKMIALNASHKIIADLDGIVAALETRCPDTEVVRIAGLSREEVADIFRHAAVFIDLAHFPGKDRMPREAVAAGCHLLIAHAGAGATPEDFPIPDFYRVNPFDTAGIVEKAAHIVDNPGQHDAAFHACRNGIAQEKALFHAEARALFQPISQITL